MPRRHLNVGLGLIGDLHDELSLSVDHMLQDALIDSARIMNTMRTPTNVRDVRTQPLDCQSWIRKGTLCLRRSTDRERPNEATRCTSRRDPAGTSSSCHLRRSLGRGVRTL